MHYIFLGVCLIVVVWFLWMYLRPVFPVAAIVLRNAVCTIASYFIGVGIYYTHYNLPFAQDLRTLFPIITMGIFITIQQSK